MAWTYEQKFNALNDGDLNGQDSWVGDASFDVQTAEKFEGAKAIVSAAADKNIYREITPVATGILYFAMRIASLGYEPGGVSFHKSGGAGTFTEMTFEGRTYNSFPGFRLIDHESYIKPWDFAINTWYVLACELDCPNVRHRWKMWNGVEWTAWTDWYAMHSSVGSGDSVGRITFRTSSGAVNFYFDTITPTDPTLPPGPPPTSRGFIF